MRVRFASQIFGVVPKSPSTETLVFDDFFEAAITKHVSNLLQAGFRIPKESDVFVVIRINDEWLWRGNKGKVQPIRQSRSKQSRRFRRRVRHDTIITRTSHVQ